MSKNYYELTYIINPVLDDDGFKDTVKKVNELVEKFDGEIEEIDEWGLRQIAFPMDKKSSGYYVNLYFHAPGTTIAPLERAMRIDDNILRYLTIKYDAKMLRHRELQKKNEVPDIFAIDEDEEE